MIQKIVLAAAVTVLTLAAAYFSYSFLGAEKTFVLGLVAAAIIMVLQAWLSEKENSDLE